jgi:hypothetical protein
METEFSFLRRYVNLMEKGFIGQMWQTLLLLQEKAGKNILG